MKKSACFLLQCFLEIYIRLFHHKIPLIYQLQVDPNPPPSKKRKEEPNYDSILLAAMKIPEAQLCYLPLDFSSSHKPNPSRHCDASNCFFILFPTNTEMSVVLACSHTYHDSCYINN